MDVDELQNHGKFPELTWRLISLSHALHGSENLTVDQTALDLASSVQNIDWDIRMADSAEPPTPPKSDPETDEETDGAVEDDDSIMGTDADGRDDDTIMQSSSGSLKVMPMLTQDVSPSPRRRVGEPVS